MTALLKNKLFQRVILFAVILLLVYMSYKFLGKIGKDIKHNKDVKTRKKDLQEVLDGSTENIGGSALSDVKTYTTPDYTLFADSLFAAMDGAGTDEQTIFAILSALRTKADWLATVSAFGNKEASSYLSSFNGSLTKWLSDELGSSEKTQVNNILGKFNVRI